MADDDLPARILQLEALTAELARQVAELRVAATGRFASMRDSRRCPACGGGWLVHVRRVRESADHAVDAGIVHKENNRWSRPVSFGPMESFSCRTCGLVEYHVTDFADVPIDGTDVVAIEPEGEPPSDGPFR